jgi:hypothetical protein
MTSSIEVFRFDGKSARSLLVERRQRAEHTRKRHGTQTFLTNQMAESDEQMARRIAAQESDADMARRLQEELARGDGQASQPAPRQPDPDNENRGKRDETDEEMARRLQAELNVDERDRPPRRRSPSPPPPQGGVSREELIRVCERVMDMTGNRGMKDLANRHGLELTSVSWEDAGRWKNSKWGPCISDMTLQFELYRLPVLRYPNYQDLTWDVPLDKIPLVVGNEVRHGKPTLYSVTLREYLRNIRMYCSYPEYFPNSHRQDSSVEGLYAPQRDSHAIMSAQACFLPVPKGAETEFNVALFNPRSRKNDPAVLVIMASAQGTSCQIVDSMDEFDGQQLFHNAQGRRCPLVAQRLGDNRRERGVAVEGAMTKEERQQNAVLSTSISLLSFVIVEFLPPRPFCADWISLLAVIQVPLKQFQRQPRRRHYADAGYNGGGGFGDGLVSQQEQAAPHHLRQKKMVAPRPSYGGARGGGMAAPSSASLAAYPQPAPPPIDFFDDDDDDGSASDYDEEDADVEAAIIKVGDDQGAFREFGGLPVRRDPTFPIRATLQFYKSTATGVASEADVAAVAKQIRESQRSADYIGSLVVAPQVGRPTENPETHPRPAPPPLSGYTLPAWWQSFWLTHGSSFSIPELTAQRRAFSPGIGDPNLARQPLTEAVRGRVLALLTSGGGPIHHPIHPPYPPHTGGPFYPQPEPCIDPYYSSDEDDFDGPSVRPPVAR